MPNTPTYEEKTINLRFEGHERLMMFYLLPRELVEKVNLLDFPRDPYEVFSSPKWIARYKDEYFDLVLYDTWAWLVWPHFGIRGGMESYSGYDPFWCLAHAITLWIRTLKKMGMNAQQFFTSPPGAKLRYLSHEETDAFAKIMVDYYIRHSKFNEIKEIVKAHRAHEDYDARYSNVKIDFYRSYYHTRSKYKTVGLDQAVNEGYDPYDDIDNHVGLEAFISRLQEKEQQIVKLLLAGYKQAEIAKALGYANHSGVCKRIAKIGKLLLEHIKS